MANENEAAVASVDQALMLEVQSNLGKVDETALVLFTQCASSFFWGGNWSLISTNDEDYKDLAKRVPEIKEKYAKQVHIAKVKGGILLETNTDWLLQVMGTLAPKYASANSAGFLQRVKEVRETESERFAKYWKKTVEGKTDMFKQKDDKGNSRLAGALGVYCTNVNSLMTVNGVSYPAFKLSPSRICEVISSDASASRVSVAAHDSSGSSNQSAWVSLQQLANNPQLLYKTLAFPTDMRGAVINRPNALIMRFAVR